MMYNQQQHQAFPNAVPGQAPMIMPMMYIYQQDQTFPNPAPGQAPMFTIRPMMYNHQQDQAFPNPVPGQAPMMYNHQQDLVVPDAVPGQAPMIRPVTTNHNQDQAVPNVVPGQAPMMNNQNQPMANQIPDIDPPMMLPPNYTYNPRHVFVITQNFLNPHDHLDITQFSYGSDNEFGVFDWVNVVSDSVFSDDDLEFPVNIASIPVGFVLSVKGKKVIVEGKEDHIVLKGSFLWVSETRLPLGYVDKIFGTVKKPCFRVKFKSESQVPQGIGEGTEVSIIVEDFVQHDKNGCEDAESQVPQGISQGTQVSLEDFAQHDKKGCDGDASADEIKLSDDEKEADCKMMAKTGNTGNKKDVLGFERLVLQYTIDNLLRMGEFAAPRRSETETNQQKTGNTGDMKDVLGLERSEEQAVLSPTRSDSEISPVSSQAIVGAGGIVPQDQPLPRMGKFAAPRKSETETETETNQQKTGNNKDVLGLERTEQQTLPSPNRSEISPVKSEAIVGAGGMVPQDQPLPQVAKFVAPWRSVTNQPKPYQPPMANQMGMPKPNPMAYTQPRFRNRQNYNNQQPYSNANAPTRPELNYNRVPPQCFRQRNPQTQSQSSDAKPSQRGAQHYFRGVGKGRGFAIGRGRALDQA
ncbi:hypothetical protein AALP_AA6G044100 [Arabis alpina]|uniref:H/ACA ribonucleoprotein complex non-core subunit NAF1 n=1 Tax=Arabis alpina TaxID=50452 RepID=A0A087GM25_ARAAL|nr:hypothetical protein AALP_AA6G044100 [Arabis alpina]